MGIKITGTNKLKKLQRDIKKLEGKNTIPFNEMFNDSFLRKYSKFENHEDFINREIFKTYDSLEDIPDDEMDKFISENSKFDTWEKFLGKASEEYVAKKLGF